MTDCNEFCFTDTRAALDAAFGQAQVPLGWADTPSTRPPGEPIRPTNRATLLRPIDPAHPRAGLEGLEIRWWMVPAFHKGPVADWRTLCTNARVETLDTAPIFRNAYRARRGLVPLTAFIAYGEPPGWKKGQPKMRHAVTWGDPSLRYVAALWETSHPADLPDGLESFALVSGPAGPDVQPLQDRAPAILTLDQGLAWLDLDGPGAAGVAALAPAGAY
ncbi:MAG: SOS response-associated peptidase family protein, partial [Alphaproteobacteria bacterium]|nr:SOS response-associated peptidase family protein [Alphaproteobacteria bacterium]